MEEGSTCSVLRIARPAIGAAAAVPPSRRAERNYFQKVWAFENVGVGESVCIVVLGPALRALVITLPDGVLPPSLFWRPLPLSLVWNMDGWMNESDSSLRRIYSLFFVECNLGSLGRESAFLRSLRPLAMLMLARLCDLWNYNPNVTEYSVSRSGIVKISPSARIIEY